MLIDLTFAALLILAIIKGYQKGLILAIFSILAFIIGLTAALKLSAVVAAYLQDNVTVSSRWLPFIAFVLVFLIVVLLVRLGAGLIEKTFQVLLLGWANRIGGILLYTALYLIILSIFIFYAEKLQLLQPASIESSATYAFIQPWGPKLMDKIGSLVPMFKDMFTQLGDFFNSLPNKIPH
jgi:membrane protein required for colicin V production